MIKKTCTRLVRYFILSAFIFIGGIHPLHSQTFRNVYFDKILPGSIVQNPSSGYLIIGGTLINNQQKITFHQVDSLGNTQWIKYGDISVNNTAWSGPSVYVTNYSYEIILGNVIGSVESEFVFLKLDFSGNILSTKRYKHHVSINQGCAETHNGGYYLFSSTYLGDSLHIIKTDSLGQEIWTKAILNETNQYKISRKFIRPSIDGGFFIYGSVFPPGAGVGVFGTLFVLKADSAGEVQWTRAYYNSEYSFVEWNDLFQTSDSGFVMIGYSALSLDTSFQKIAKFDITGNFLWGEKLIPIAEHNQFHKIQEDYAGDMFVRGYSANDSTLIGSTITKFSSVGSVIRVNVFEVNPNFSYDFILTNDNGFAAVSPYRDTANYSLNTCLIKMNQAGHTGCLDSVLNQSVIPISPLDSSLIIVTVNDNSDVTTSPYILTNLISTPATELCQIINSIEQLSSFNSTELFPNPSDGIFHLRSSEEIRSISVYDVTGRIILRSENIDILDISNFKNGIYFVELTTTANNVYRQKIIKK